MEYVKFSYIKMCFYQGKGLPIIAEVRVQAPYLVDI